jgi:tetratricopeptide (TPR) repeat protein
LPTSPLIAIDHRVAPEFRGYANPFKSQVSPFPSDTVRRGLIMRRLALLAVLVGVCGCSSRTPEPSSEQTTSEMPAGGVTQSQPASPKPSAASYLGPHDRSYTSLPAGVKSELENAEKQIHEGQLGTAVQTLSLLIGENPKNSLAFVLRGQANAERRNDADALADFSTAVELEPANPERLSARGFFRLSRGNTVDALADFNRSIELDPNNARAHNNRGMARLTSGEVKQAIEDFDSCIKIDPKFVAAYNNRSFAYAKMDRRQEALADLDQAIRLDSNAAGSYDNRGALWLDAQEYQKAIADFTRAIELDSSSPNYYAHRRVAWTKLERFPEAQADALKIEHLVQLSSLNAAVFRDPRSPKPYIDRGNYFLHENQVENALANFNKALELNPKNAEALTARSRAALRHGDPQKAVDDATAALAIEPREETYGVRADAYRKLQDYQKAVADYDSAQRIDQDVEETWNSYAQALQQAGRTKEADEALRRVADLKALNAPTRVVSASTKPRG